MTTNEYNLSVDLYADSIYRFVLKQVKDADTARDLVQDTFERLWIKAAEVSFEKVKSYLFTTAYHCVIDYNRREKKKDNYDEAKFKKIGFTSQYTDLREVLDEALLKLPEIQKTVILLRDYEGYNYREIGEITGLNESQVKVYIFRARKFLKDYIIAVENVI
jgi:RNA polymerase sigma-70 factor (ECF subfamily)